MRNYYLSLCLFLLSFPLYVEAQSPSGVDGVELWHMTVQLSWKRGCSWLSMSSKKRT